MMKATLKTTQPIFYQILEKAFSQNRIPHAYLLCAKKGVNLHQVAMFLCKSFICEQDVLACEACNDCRRMDEGSYIDFISFDGKEESIKKKHIESIQNTFKKSSMEGSARVYLLENIDYATPEAMNSLLKLLEEPMPGIYAVLTCENINRVLPTIQSRCQLVQFKAVSQEALGATLIKDGMKEENAKVLSQMYDNIDDIKEIEISERFMNLKVEAINFIEDYFTKRENLLINCQTHVFKNFNNREDMQFFLDLLLVLFKDVMYLDYGLDISFVDQKELMSKYEVNKDEIIEILELILKTKEAIKNNANLMLLMDSFVYAIQRR